MKKIVSRLTVLLLLVSVFVPMLPADVHSQALNSSEMQNVIGGQPSISCDSVAEGMAALCGMLGGGWITCTIVSAAAYLGCLAANAIAGS